MYLHLGADLTLVKQSVVSAAEVGINVGVIDG